MINLPYSLIIEATDEPDYFGFYSPELNGFTGIGYSPEDCLTKAEQGIREHAALLAESGRQRSFLPDSFSPSLCGRVDIRNRRAYSRLSEKNIN